MFQARTPRTAPAKPLTEAQERNRFWWGYANPSFRLKAITLSVIGISLFFILTTGLPRLIG